MYAVYKRKHKKREVIKGIPYSKHKHFTILADNQNICIYCLNKIDVQVPLSSTDEKKKIFEVQKQRTEMLNRIKKRMNRK